MLPARTVSGVISAMLEAPRKPSWHRGGNQFVPKDHIQVGIGSNDPQKVLHRLLRQ